MEQTDKMDKGSWYNVDNEKAIRVNIKQNFKGEKGYEYTIRGDTKEELEKLLKEVKELLNKGGLI